MSSVVISGNTSGAITLSAPDVSGTNTATLPAATGTVMVSGNMPAFSVYMSADQTTTAGTWTKVTFNTEEYDTANCFDSSTNYRFTPTVAGYYQINCMLSAQTGINTNDIGLYKNGSLFKFQRVLGASNFIELVINYVMYFNGTTDYAEMYFRSNTNAGYVNGTSTFSTFSGCLLRTA
jgi:hypothetical protein